MTKRTEVIPVELANGGVLFVEASVLPGEEDIAFDLVKFEDVSPVIRGLTTELVSSLDTSESEKTTVEFGLELALESGKFIAVLAKGSAKVNLKVTLEWGKSMSTGT